MANSFSALPPAIYAPAVPKEKLEEEKNTLTSKIDSLLHENESLKHLADSISRYSLCNFLRFGNNWCRHWLFKYNHIYWSVECNRQIPLEIRLLASAQTCYLQIQIKESAGILLISNRSCSRKQEGLECWHLFHKVSFKQEGSKPGCWQRVQAAFFSATIFFCV